MSNEKPFTLTFAGAYKQWLHRWINDPNHVDEPTETAPAEREEAVPQQDPSPEEAEGEEAKKAAGPWYTYDN